MSSGNVALVRARPRTEPVCAGSGNPAPRARRTRRDSRPWPGCVRAMPSRPTDQEHADGGAAGIRASGDPGLRGVGDPGRRGSGASGIRGVGDPGRREDRAPRPASGRRNRPRSPPDADRGTGGPIPAGDARAAVARDAARSVPGRTAKHRADRALQALAGFANALKLTPRTSRSAWTCRRSRDSLTAAISSTTCSRR